METINLNNITFEQFQTTEYYNKSFNNELIRDLSLQGAMDFMVKTFITLKDFDAVLELEENSGKDLITEGQIRIPC